MKQPPNDGLSPGEDPFAEIPNIDERLADWVDGVMSDRDRERFEAEMRVSPPLREQAESYKQTVDSIRSALTAEIHEVDLADRIMARVNEPRATEVAPRRPVWPLAWAAMSAAALLGIAILINSWGGLNAPKALDFVAAKDDPNGQTSGLESALEMPREPQFDSPEVSDNAASIDTISVTSKTKSDDYYFSSPPDLAESSPKEGLADPGAVPIVGDLERGRKSEKNEGPSSPSGAVRRNESVGETGSVRYGGRGARQNVNVDGALRPTGSLRSEERSLQSAETKPDATGGALPPTAGHSPKDLADVKAKQPTLEEGEIASKIGRQSQAVEPQGSPGANQIRRLPSQSRLGALYPNLTLECPPRGLVRQKPGVPSTIMVIGAGEAGIGAQLSAFLASQMERAELGVQELGVQSGVNLSLRLTNDGSQSVDSLRIFGFDAEESDVKKQGDERSGVANSERLRSTEKPGKPSAQSARKGRRDWLIVGPRSEVATVLAAMRTYAKAHRGQCRSGEVRLLIGSEVESSSKSADDGSGGSGVGGVGSKESVAATGAPAVEGGSPTDPVRPSVDKAAKSDPIQRIVVSFRIKQ